MVLECTGVYLDRKALQPYFNMGVKKVSGASETAEYYLMLHISYWGYAMLHLHNLSLVL